MKTVLPLLAFALFPLMPASAQDTQPKPAANAPATVSPTVPKEQSGIGQGIKSDSAKMGTLDADDADFVRMSATGGMAEVVAGKEASHSANAMVKDFGQKMVQDHTNLGQELASVAKTKGVEMPTELAADDATEIKKMNGMNGTAFDSAYLKSQVLAHQKAIALFQKEAEEGTDADLKVLAQGALPKLREHLATAQDLAAKMPAQ